MIASMQYASTRNQNPAYVTRGSGCTYTGCATAYPPAIAPAGTAAAKGAGLLTGTAAELAATICAPHLLQNVASSARLLPHLEQYTCTPCAIPMPRTVNIKIADCLAESYVAPLARSIQPYPDRQLIWSAALQRRLCGVSSTTQISPHIVEPSPPLPSPDPTQPDMLRAFNQNQLRVR